VRAESADDEGSSCEAEARNPPLPGGSLCEAVFIPASAKQQAPAACGGGIAGSGASMLRGLTGGAEGGGRKTAPSLPAGSAGRGVAVLRGLTGGGGAKDASLTLRGAGEAGGGVSGLGGVVEGAGGQKDAHGVAAVGSAAGGVSVLRAATEGEESGGKQKVPSLAPGWGGQASKRQKTASGSVPRPAGGTIVPEGSGRGSFLRAIPRLMAAGTPKLVQFGCGKAPASKSRAHPHRGVEGRSGTRAAPHSATKASPTNQAPSTSPKNSVRGGVARESSKVSPLAAPQASPAAKGLITSPPQCAGQSAVEGDSPAATATAEGAGHLSAQGGTEGAASPPGSDGRGVAGKDSLGRPSITPWASPSSPHGKGVSPPQTGGQWAPATAPGAGHPSRGRVASPPRNGGQGAAAAVAESRTRVEVALGGGVGQAAGKRGSGWIPSASKPQVFIPPLLKAAGSTSPIVDLIMFLIKRE